MLEVKDLTVYRGELCVFKDLSLRVYDGEVVALLGPNCAGKTTLLETIAGIIKPLAGKIFLKGEDITNLPPYKRISRGIGFVSGREYLFHNMTVEENLELGMYASPEKRNLKEAMEWVFLIFPRLKVLRKKAVSKLSGGEQQMVAIARVLIRRPSFLMLDEPTSGLAPKVVSEIFDTLTKLKKPGISLLLVEQYISRALQISDRAYILSSGKIVLETDAKDLLKEDNKKILMHYFGSSGFS
ncbi:MAG: ABC transporter ATP-binding protein [Candidatus Bathyarchaeia archaeon]